MLGEGEGGGVRKVERVRETENHWEDKLFLCGQISVVLKWSGHVAKVTTPAIESITHRLGGWDHT